MATKAENFLQTSKEILIAAIQAHPSIITVDKTGSPANDKAANIVEYLKTITAGVAEAHEIANK